LVSTGEIVWIDLPGVVPTQRRPAVVLSASTYHATRLDIMASVRRNDAFPAAEASLC